MRAHDSFCIVFALAVGCQILGLLSAHGTRHVLRHPLGNVTSQPMNVERRRIGVLQGTFWAPLNVVF